MIFCNSLISLAANDTPLPEAALKKLTLLISPFAPHLAEECWRELGEMESISKAAWPQYNDDLCTESTVSVVVQVNGKVRGKVEADVNAGKDEVYQLAIDTPNVRKYVSDSAKIEKIVYVAGKILNIVLYK